MNKKNITIIKCKKNAFDAEQVLIDNGFTMLSSLFDKNEFSKDGKLYKIAHPVWEMDKAKNEFLGVRITEGQNCPHCGYGL